MSDIASIKGSSLPIAGSIDSADYLIGLVAPGPVTSRIPKSLVQGAKGDQGIQGNPGTNGANGESADWADTADRQLIAWSQSRQSVGENWVQSWATRNNVAANSTNLAGELLESSGVAGDVYNESLNADYFFHSHRTQMVFIGRVSNTTDTRFFCGFHNTTAVNMLASASPAFSYVGFRYDTTVPDANFKIVTNNGGAPTVVDTGVAPSATDSKVFRVEWAKSGTTARFYIDDVLILETSTTLPADATGLKCLVGIRNHAGGTKGLYYTVLKVRHSVIAA